MRGVVEASGIILFSELNPKMDIFIYIANYTDPIAWTTITEIASNAYETWMSCDGEEGDMYGLGIGDYIEKELEEGGYLNGEDYEMFFTSLWDK